MGIEEAPRGPTTCPDAAAQRPLGQREPGGAPPRLAGPRRRQQRELCRLYLVATGPQLRDGEGASPPDSLAHPAREGEPPGKMAAHEEVETFFLCSACTTSSASSSSVSPPPTTFDPVRPRRDLHARQLRIRLTPPPPTEAALVPRRPPPWRPPELPPLLAPPPSVRAGLCRRLALGGRWSSLRFQPHLIPIVACSARDEVVPARTATMTTRGPPPVTRTSSTTGEDGEADVSGATTREEGATTRFRE
jgi:hypothetical protein